MTTSKYLKLTWEDVDRALDHLTKQIKKSRKKYDYIYPIPRGGLIVGVCLSHKLNLPVELMEVCSYDEILVVDDINDTGNTLFEYNFLNKDTAVLVERDDTKYKAKFVGLRISADEPWVLFPWEIEKSTKRGNKA